MGVQIGISKEKIADFCRRNHIHSFAFFGSVLRADFGPDSDVDILVEFEKANEPGLMELVRMEDELTEIFGRKADLVERKAVENSKNYIRRRHILQKVENISISGMETIIKCWS